MEYSFTETQALYNPYPLPAQHLCILIIFMLLTNENWKMLRTFLTLLCKYTSNFLLLLLYNLLYTQHNYYIISI